MFVNYDEWGGFFDHVSPVFVPDDRSSPNLDENFGITGFRVPGVAISPYAHRNSVSHMQVTHESILKLITYKFGLGDLNKRHRYASNIGESFNWAHPNFSRPSLPRVLPPIGVLPCDLQKSKGGAAAESRASRRQERSEGLHIGDPAMLDYIERMGYKVAPAKPDEVFATPEAVRRMRSLWGAR
jgi:phospholipase C